MPKRTRHDLRALAADAMRFARAFPALAGRLGHSGTEPTTERIVEGNYYLGATVLDKIDDYEQGAYELLSQRASPWLQRPIPASTVVSFAAPSEARVIPCGTALSSYDSGAGTFTFRTVADVVVGPHLIREAAIDAGAHQRDVVVRFTVEATGKRPVNETVAAGLAIFIGGELETALELVHALVSDLESVTVTSDDWAEPIVAPLGALRRMGMCPSESAAPDPDGPGAAFGIITEAFLVPDRFRLVLLDGLHACESAKDTSRILVALRLRRPLRRATAGTLDLRANCAFVTNLFEADSEPMAVDVVRGPVPLRVAGVAHDSAVYAIQVGWATAADGSSPPVRLRDLRRLSAGPSLEASPSFAVSPSRSPDAPAFSVTFSSAPGTAPANQTERVASFRLLATNGPRAGKLRSGDVAGSVTIGTTELRFRNVVPCSPYVRPPTGKVLARRALGHASLTRGRDHYLASLKDALYLAIPSWSVSPEVVRAAELRVDALRSLDISAATERAASGAMRRGYAYHLTLDDGGFGGVGDLALVGAALAEALSRTAPMNTFARLTIVGASGIVHTYGSGGA